ncbi:hypothetical protein V8E51_007759 [Hyaloscypha variabilis]
MALICAGHELYRAVHIINTSSWDTDCNPSNFGFRALISSIDGGYSLNNAVRTTFDLDSLGRKLAGEPSVAPSKKEAQFHFSLSSNEQGFLATRKGLLPNLVKVEQAVDDQPYSSSQWFYERR